jgi:thiol-disulfide isomerase/thioredoxin
LEFGYDEKEHISYRPEFLTIKGNDTLALNSFVFDCKIKTVHGKYIGSKVFKDFFTANGLCTLNFDSFLFDYPVNTEWDLLLQYPSFSSFSSQKDVEKNFTYEDFLSEYENAIKEHPSSGYFLNNVYLVKYRYKSSEDLKRIYYSFSDSIRNTAIGDSLNRYLKSHSSEFSNCLLPECNTGKEELIVRDTSKFNLIIFSASWCAPCHAQIPLLKEIYGQLKPNLEITYISIDTMGQIADWKKLIKEKSIPWRSLLTGEKSEEVIGKYSANAIPHSILIYPGGRKMEVIDVRDVRDKEKLFKLVQNR